MLLWNQYWEYLPSSIDTGSSFCFFPFFYILYVRFQYGHKNLNRNIKYLEKQQRKFLYLAEVKKKKFQWKQAQWIKNSLKWKHQSCVGQRGHYYRGRDENQTFFAILLSTLSFFHYLTFESSFNYAFFLWPLEVFNVFFCVLVTQMHDQIKISEMTLIMYRC